MILSCPRIIPLLWAGLLPAGLAGQGKPDSTSRARPLDAVVVSATRTEQTLREIPAQVVVLGQPAIAASSGQTVIDLLRTVPGFTTRDFQAGVISGPSQSIVSFRGLGGSSAGRALVLLDGLPAGDPFSGWLDWGRIPLPMLESAEVVRGGGSITWGSRSLGGVVNLRTIAPTRDEMRLMLEGGSLGTYHGAAAGTLRRGALTASLGADYRDTDGFVLLPAHQAGPIDRREALTSRALTGKVGWDPTPAIKLWGSANAFTGGDRPLGIKGRQDFREIRGGMRWLSPGGGMATVALFANGRKSENRSFTINSERTVQTPQREQDSPAQSHGVSLQWTQTAFDGHEVSAGVDFSRATGSLTEFFDFSTDRFVQAREVEGVQYLGGVFLQDAAALSPTLRLLASVRADRVRNSGGTRRLRDLTLGSTVSDTAFHDRTTHRLTGSLGMRWEPRPWLAWRASLYEAFRAPSMYEMYYARFSSSGSVTEANAALDPERLRGAELGADFILPSGFLSRVTVFTNRVRSPIMDITIGRAGTQPEVIQPCGLMGARRTCSQRQNVSGLQSHGVEAELEWQPSVAWALAGGYSFSPTRVVAPGQPVDGMQAIRSARHMVNSRVTFHAPRWFTTSLEARYVGVRYDDDLNTIDLAGFTLLGLRLNRDLAPGISAHLKIDNLLDEGFEVTRSSSGQAEMGAPRWITLGVKAAW